MKLEPYPVPPVAGTLRSLGTAAFLLGAIVSGLRLVSPGLLGSAGASAYYVSNTRRVPPHERGSPQVQPEAHSHRAPRRRARRALQVMMVGLVVMQIGGMLSASGALEVVLLRKDGSRAVLFSKIKERRDPSLEDVRQALRAAEGAAQAQS